MLSVRFGDQEKNCAGMTRRNVLQAGALGVGGLTLSHLLAARSAVEKSSGSPNKNTSVVWLWLNGGPTHIETFDPKMTAPVEYRSVSGEVKTTLPGVTFGGHFEKMAEQADKMAIVRSFKVPSSSHRLGAFWVNTGYGQKEDRPSLGSVVSRARGPNDPETGMPTYVQIGRFGFGSYSNLMTGPTWLGKAYGPFKPDGPDRENMNLTLDLSRLDDRRSLLKSLDQLRREADASGLMEGMDGFNQQALDLVLGNAPQAFDLEKEDPKLVERYGEGLGESMLMARRLCETGCGFVGVSSQGWDMHGGILKNLDRRAPNVDRAVSAFLEDLHARGLEKDILLVISGEFGRTPRINSRAGRDHWGPLSTLALAGGGLEMGQVIGESSRKAEEPVSNPVTVQDLMATVFHTMGIPSDLHFTDPSGRPVPMLSEGRVIEGLV